MPDSVIGLAFHLRMHLWPRISDYRADGTSIWASCPADVPCGHSAELDLAAIIKTKGDLRLDALRRRLRCKCGARPARLSLIPPSPGESARIWETRKRLATAQTAEFMALIADRAPARR
jgi:hypothetical protein